jgi:hypothetical protein
MVLVVPPQEAQPLREGLLHPRLGLGRLHLLQALLPVRMAQVAPHSLLVVQLVV